MFNPPHGARLVPYKIQSVQATTGLSSAATPLPYVTLIFDVSQGYSNFMTDPATYEGGATEYWIYRDGIHIATVPSPDVAQPTNSLMYAVSPNSLTFIDNSVQPAQLHAYSVMAVWGVDAVHGSATTPVTIMTASEPTVVTPPPVPVDPPNQTGGVIRWRFIDIYHKGPAPYEYTFHVNPNAGGTPIAEKNLTIAYSAGPRVMGIVQEGGWGVPKMAWSGVILAQDHLEALEAWYEQRILIELHDDLGRVMRGVFNKFNPQRIRRSTRAWYHTYEAEFTVTGYRDASGHDRYVRLQQPGLG